jgi:gliding motility-associated-like protein
VRDEHGCSVVEVINIPRLNVLVVDEVISTPADCRGNSGQVEVVARGGSGLLTYQLDTIVQTNPEFEGLAPGNYLLTVTDDSGCSQTEQLTIARGDCPIYIANAFSPNGDGINDRFAVFAASGIDGQVVSYQIFNRWGNQVYEAGGFPLGDASRWWDGMVQGRPVAAGMYVYHLVIELSGGEEIVEQGEVNVVR